MKKFLKIVKNIPVHRLIWLVWALFCLTFGMGPIIFGYYNFGTILITLYSIVILLMVFLGDSRLGKKTRKVFWGGISLITVCAILMTSVMLWAAYGTDYDGYTPSTVVVLGCKVSDGKPSLMLKYRMDRAYEMLYKYPDLNCVVSGGHTEGQPMSEAEVMYIYLVEKGIFKDRLYLENFSKSTQENLAFSSRVISENNLSKNIIISTDGFHQFRAAFYSRLNGLTPHAATCKTPMSLTPGYYVREFAAIGKLLLLDLAS